MPSSNGGVNGDALGEEGVEVVDVVGAKGIKHSFQFVHITILNLWI